MKTKNPLTAVLISSDNAYLTYPCNVEIGIIERGVTGQILQCNVKVTGSKVFVRAKKAIFDREI